MVSVILGSSYHAYVFTNVHLSDHFKVSWMIKLFQLCSSESNTTTTIKL